MLLSVVRVAAGATVFEDGFESGSLGPTWTVSTTGDGRASISTNFLPASGQWHLVLDDSVTDELYSVAECTLRLDLSDKRNVVLTFKAKSLGNEEHDPEDDATRTFDGISISLDGGVTWRIVDSLVNVDATWEDFRIVLDDELYDWRGERFGPGFRIRFSEFDNASAPLDGIAIDDVLVTADDDKHIIVEAPATVIEGSGPQFGYVLLSPAPTNALTLALDFSPPELIVATNSITIPAGQKSATFSFSVPNDKLFNLSRWVTIRTLADGYASTDTTVRILDDDVPSASLRLPTQLVEGGPVSNNNATVTLDHLAGVSFYVDFRSIPSGEIYVPSLYFSVGQTQAVFTVSAYDDSRIDGAVPVTVIAELGGVPIATNQLTVLDNEQRTLALELPAQVQEGGAGFGMVRIPGYLGSNLLVTLASSDPTAATVPANVIILAGVTYAPFAVTAPDNSLRDGSRTVILSATAPSFASTNASLTVRDNDAARYWFEPLSDFVDIGSPVAVTVSAADIFGNPINGATGAVHLSVVLPDGSAFPLSPQSVSFGNSTGWTGNVTLPAVNVTPLRLRAADDTGRTGETGPFDILRTLDLPAADLVWDALHNRIYASVTNNSGSNAQSVVAIDPTSARAVRSVFIGQNPGRLALTSGSESLYVTRDGNGTIARVNLEDMSVASTFVVGSHTDYGTLFAADICAVTRQPDVLLVSRRSAGPYSVAAYDAGSVRTNVTQLSYGGPGLIEPSADPTVFFNVQADELRRLRLGPSGVSVIESKSDLFSYYESIEDRSDGDRIFSTRGMDVDGARMKLIGRFPTSGSVCPELAANRVYFLEFSIYPYAMTVGAYDPATHLLIRKLRMPIRDPYPYAFGSFIRWGSNGFAFRWGTNVVLLNSSRLVPNAPAASLAIRLEASPMPASVGVPLTYTLQVTNAGPNAAPGTFVMASLSDGQNNRQVTSSQGSWSVTNSTINFELGTLASNAVATLTITTEPTSAGSLSCTVGVVSEATDLDNDDNSATSIVRVGVQTAINTVNRLRFFANNLVFDPTRNRIWAVGNDTNGQAFDAVVAIDPTTGLVSSPIGTTGGQAASMALSGNGRYLYIGVSGSPEVLRWDLEANPPSLLRVPLGTNQFFTYATDIEPLDGDGASFLVSTYGDYAASVFDGVTRRPDRASSLSVGKFVRTGTPGVFVLLHDSVSLSRIVVTDTGVTPTQRVSNIITGASEISGDNDLILSSSGLLVNSTSLSLIASLGATGSPCLDVWNQRAFLLDWNTLRAFDTGTALPVGTLTLPASFYPSYDRKCIRWGLDGFAFSGKAWNGADVYLARWSEAIPSTTDFNADGISDSWEATYFNSLNVDPAVDEDRDGIRNFQEYIFGTSPIQASPNPMQVSAATIAGQPALRLVFPRRAGLPPQSYEFVMSSDLTQWAAVSNVTETVLSTQTVDGILMDTVEALIPSNNPASAFVRFKWLH